MKGRLITNGVLSLVANILAFVSIILLISAMGEISKHTNVDENGVRQLDPGYEGEDVLGIIAGGTLLFWVSWLIVFATIIMGIVTLSMHKREEVRDLTITSGILAILSGIPFVGIAGAIVSFIGAYKIHQVEKNPVVDIETEKK